MTGVLSEGPALRDAIIAQNGRTLSQLSRKVALGEQGANGIFAGDYPTEAGAWAHVERILRVHVPMQAELISSVSKFDTWMEEVDKENEELKKARRPEGMVDMLLANTLRNNGNNCWLVGTKIVARTSSRLQGLSDEKDQQITRAGLIGYYLYLKIEKNSNLNFDNCIQSAQVALQNQNSQIDPTNVNQAMQLQATRDARIDFLKNELGILNGLGAALNNANVNDAPPQFCENMLAQHNIQDSLAKEIWNFYHKVALWLDSYGI